MSMRRRVDSASERRQQTLAYADEGDAPPDDLLLPGTAQVIILRAALTLMGRVDLKRRPAW
jgi:hypothetical protein